jgi:hypothetical protein
VSKRDDDRAIARELFVGRASFHARNAFTTMGSNGEAPLEAAA